MPCNSGTWASSGRRAGCYPNLPLQAAGNFGTHNSPGLRLAATLGFTRVVLAGPISLKDLALMRRQTAMPLAVALATGCQGYAGFCLMEEYLGLSCDTCCLARPEDAGTLMAALETFSGLCQLGVEAVQLRGELFAPASLAQVIGLYQSVAPASPMERPRVLAAARQVLAAFGETSGCPLRPRKPLPALRWTRCRPAQRSVSSLPGPGYWAGAASGWRPGITPRPRPCPGSGGSPWCWR